MVDIETAIAANRQRLIGSVEAPIMRQLSADYARVIRSIEGEVTRLAEQIAAQGGASLSQAQRMQHLQRIAAQVEGEVGAIARREARALTAARRQAVAAGTRDAQALVGAVTPSGATVSVPATQIMVAAAAPPSPLAQVFARMPGVAGEAVRNALVDGVIRGENPRVVMRHVEEALGGQRARAMVIAQTEVMRAYRGAAQDLYRENSDIVDHWMWVSALDERACPVCWAMHGETFPLTAPLGSHPACRCVAAPVPRTAAPALQPDVLAGAQEFERLSIDAQRRILRPAAFHAYQDGVIDLQDIVGYRNDRNWGPTRFRRPLQDVLGRARAVGYYGRAA